MGAEIHVDDYVDYLTIDGLKKVSGVDKEYHIALAVKELVDNALDAAGKCILKRNGQNSFYVQDEGSGIPGEDEEIAYLFSVDRKTYSTKGERYPRRGYMGRGLRFVSGVAFCHSATLKVTTGGRTLLLKPQLRGTMHERIMEDNDNFNGTTISVEFPMPLPSNALNWGNLAIKLAKGPDYKYFSSPFWYDSRSFYVLLKSISYNNKKIINVLKEIFGGRYSIKVFDEKSQELLKQTKADEITVEDAQLILEELKRIHKPIKPSKLGYVGELKGFKYYLKKLGEYKDVFEQGGESESINIPYVVELWAQPTNKKDSNPDVYGDLTIFVNKTPLPIPPEKVKSTHIYNNKVDLFINFKNKLKRYSEFYLNVIAPYLPVLSESKIPTFPDKIKDDIEILFLKMIKKINREKRGEGSSIKKHFDTSDKALKVKEIHNKVIEEYNRLLDNEGLIGRSSECLSLSKEDPFDTGMKLSKIERAMWFKEIWEELNPEGKVVHLRRLHYQIVSQSRTILRHTNEPYTNNHYCWEYLLKTAKYARELGYVDPLKIIDMRAPSPHGAFLTSFILEKEMDFPPWITPEISFTSFRVGDFKIPELKIDIQRALETVSALQPVHLEIWTEKSTMNDILEEICRRYGVILVQNVGYASITNIEKFLRERAMETEKPSVILYISDYDEAGENMPVTVSRTLQHRILQLRKEGKLSEKKEICVNPIILTKEQMESKDFAILPKAPGRKKKESKVTELDALEAIMPGKFKQIVEENIEKFLDKDLIRDLPQTIESEERKFNEKLREDVSLPMKQVVEVQKKLKVIEEKYRKDLEKIQESLRKETQPYEKTLISLREEVEARANKFLSNLKIDISTDKKPNLDQNVLFLSSRPFKEQTEKLRNYRVFTK